MTDAVGGAEQDADDEQGLGPTRIADDGEGENAEAEAEMDEQDEPDEPDEDGAEENEAEPEENELEPDGDEVEAVEPEAVEPEAVETETEEPEAQAPEDGERALTRARRVRLWSRIRVALLVVTATTSLGVATAFGLAAWDIQHLTHNLKHTALLPSGFTEPPEPVDAYGRSPLNILLIGSDTRDTAADCALGGDCQAGQANPGANGDSEMLVHLSADRSNATVLSIPRDTETQLPQCAGGGRGMINSALSFGPSCQVAAVVQLTNIPIDHYIDFDFSGVIDLSNEVGGVPVCVSAAVHDPYSGLTIGAGTSNVQGKQALQFLRTRHAFYDGSDLGREQATHIFLSSLLRKVKANATLTSIGEMQSIAETVTQYTTVDNGLDSALSLLSLGQDFGEVDADRVTFLTMPWQEDTNQGDPSYQYRVEASPSADGIFADIKNDESFTTSSDSATSAGSSASASAAVPDPPSPESSGSAGSAGTSAAASTSDSPDAAQVSASSASAKASEQQAARTHPMHVDVINASGATQRYETIVSEVFQDGFVYSAGSDATATRPETTLVYSSKESAAAQELAKDLELPTWALQETGTGTTLTLTIGTDWTSGATYSAANSSYSASAAVSVPDDSYAENGANASACVVAYAPYEIGQSGSSSPSSQ